MLLLVPATVADVPIVHYRRLLVPLDGSCQAESTLPLAMRIAEAEDAELLLVHVVPVPELTEVGPLEAADIRLRQDVISRNEQVARQYLNRIRALVAERGIGARNVILSDNDVRSQLTRLIVEEAVDLVVLSAHGRSGRADVSCGSVASYLVTHAQAPLLLKLNGTLASARRMIPGSGRNGRFLSRAAL
ncbi:universal stress protein [Microbaculum sp. A6E488]|uniref:Universal stress protein n=2 Tax=Microbaculum marinisediminis TaxID=2931392 RepID=A0AAW5QVA7_9HYPH|nr:universal stress protein [Microbaculum sp. A6E488]